MVYGLLEQLRSLRQICYLLNEKSIAKDFVLGIFIEENNYSFSLNHLLILEPTSFSLYDYLLYPGHVSALYFVGYTSKSKIGNHNNVFSVIIRDCKCCEISWLHLLIDLMFV